LEESAPPPSIPPSPGFKSPEARKKFFIRAALAVAAFIALQVLLQLWPNNRFAPSGEPRWEVWLENFHMENVRAESAAVWKGDLWYVAGELSGAFKTPENRLVRLTEQGPTTVFTLAPGAAWLLAHGDTLWIFASDGLSQYDGKTAKQVPAKQLPESASAPFLLDGLPAAVREEAGVRRVVALDDDQWVERAQLFFGDAKDAPAANRLKVLAIGEQPFVFCPKGDTLYCHEGFPGKDARFPADWEAVGPVGELWAVAANEGRPWAFTVKPVKDQISTEIVGFARDAGSAAPESAVHRAAWESAAQGDRPARPAAGWKPVFSRVSPLPLTTLGAAEDDAGGCRVAYQALQWTVNVVQLKGEKVISARRYGDMDSADRPQALLALLPWAASGALSVALAAVLSAIMKVYRTDSFSGPGGWSAPCAPLMRRGLALILDVALVLGPLLAAIFGLFWILPGIEDRPDARALAYLLELLYGGMLWAATAFLIFCYSLGRWGRTPGKWAMGLRVLGMELAPCGFARALFRSLLLVVDGFLTFSFGVLMIACTVNRQRIGDLAARTIVIREPTPTTPVRSLDALA